MCMNMQYGKLIGKTIEKVAEVDVKADETGWGHFLRVRIEINLSKLLARGRLIKVKGKTL